MKHYRVNALAKKDGAVVKRKDTLAPSDKQAIATAAADPDCPVCDVWREGVMVGSIL